MIHVAPDYRTVIVKLKLRFWNANYVGTQYGGSIFSMTDPFYMVMFIENLGKEYSVWDKSARIDYLKPGKTDLIATFTLTEEELEKVRSEVALNGKTEWTKIIEVKDAHDQVIAKVEKKISIKKKN